MSSSIFRIIFFLHWLCLVIIICITTKPSQGDQTFCGRNLSDTLDLLCINGFGTKKTKKSIDPMVYSPEGSEVYETTFEFDEFPFLTMFQANSLAKIRRTREGIANECCKKPCSVEKLKLYCL
ncbi:bombyxin A-3 homolog [Eupeodes corollae]|uniref:bombyxin A-3 homolog n=1 Tax=Eupeodes corollae TaxID=290404 RepID=UPI0024938D12|nr:bombyxin A-3 homolog [Eupeodes corollae]